MCPSFFTSIVGCLVAAATSCGGEDAGAVGARVAALGGKILFALKHSFGSMDSVHVKYLSSVRLYVKLKKLFGLKDGASLCAIRHLWTGQRVFVGSSTKQFIPGKRGAPASLLCDSIVDT